MAIGVGTRAGKYELVQQIGTGGFGLVFLARDHELGRDCALKFLLPQHTGNAEHVQRFLQEARAAARIQHPGIVTVFECGQFPPTGSQVDGMVYIAMELLRGESLAARLQRGALPVAVAVAIARQVASAVEAAHQAGIVHRDLKPENVYLVPDPEAVSGERVKILDFGIAKLSQANAANVVHTATSLVLGSPRYMSPEQCQSTARVDARADIYSLGVMLFEMLCGELPFADTDVGALIAKHQMAEPPRLRTKAAGLPAGLDELVGNMLAKSPDARPPSMVAVQHVLEPFRTSTARGKPRKTTAEEVVAISATERVVANPAPRSPRSPPEVLARRQSGALPWALGGVVVAVVAMTVGVIATRSSSTSIDRRSQERFEEKSIETRKNLPTPQELRDHHRATVARRDAATLGAALMPAVYAMGPDAMELEHGASATQALMGKHIDHIPIGPRGAPIGHADDVVWWIEVGSDQRYVSSTIAVAREHEWRIAAWKLAYSVPNPLAARLAVAGKLPMPAEIVRVSDPMAAAFEVKAAFRTAMSSREEFVAAFSTRSDAIAVGTAPNELVVGGKPVRAAFTRIKSTLSLRGDVAAGRITNRAAWTAANIDYTTMGNSTQIYRVLALMLKEDERWVIAMVHFSNAGPIGKP